jgi:hypothetical protein
MDEILWQVTVLTTTIKSHMNQHTWSIVTTIQNEHLTADSNGTIGYAGVPPVVGVSRPTPDIFESVIACV